MTIKLATFNVNGIRARLGILRDWLTANRPDLVCLQEIKVQDADFPAAELEAIGYHPVFFGQKSYNGVALLSLAELSEVQRGLPELGPDQEARLICGRLGELLVINAYVPQGREVGHPAFAAKLAFLARLRQLLEECCHPDQAVVLAGDLNVAPGPLDVYDPQRLEGQVGFHPDERQAFSRLLEWGLGDLFRQLNPEKRQFTFWDYRLPKAFARDLGWRIDHLLVSPSLAQACGSCWVDIAPRVLEKPSDHTPLLAEFNI